MPTYEYKCQKCGHEFEIFQSITADRIETCPPDTCPDDQGQGKVKRLISGGGGLLFKGSGFYTTDYRSESYKKAEKEDAKAAAPSSGDKSDKSDKADKADKSSSADSSPTDK